MKVSTRVVMMMVIFRFSLIDQEIIDQLNEGRWQYEPPSTPHEKFYEMVDKNKELVDLKETFDLDVDL